VAERNPTKGNVMNIGRKALLSTALVGTALIGGVAGATAFGSASAQTTDPSSAAPANPSGPHSANGITEVPLAGDDLTKATAAANAAVPGATIERAETDAEGAAYEVHVAKSDGSEATVKLDSSFNVISVDAGRS
jgi:hypothetical protein